MANPDSKLIVNSGLVTKIGNDNWIAASNINGAPSMTLDEIEKLLCELVQAVHSLEQTVYELKNQ